MRRLAATFVATVAACLLLASCTASGSGTPKISQSRVDVDTPQLRALKADAGVAACRPGSGQGQLPELTLPCLGGGRSVDLSTLQGPLVVNLFAQWCGPCRQELPYYEALHQAHSEGRVDPDFLVLSMGTGRPPVAVPTYEELWSRNWLRMGMGMLGVLMDGTSEISDELLSGVIRPKHPSSRYWRLDCDLHSVRLNMDDASERQVSGLLALAEQMISDNRDALAEMVRCLTTPGPPGVDASGGGTETPPAEPVKAKRRRPSARTKPPD